MQFRLTYQEISDLIEKKAGRSIPVVYGGPHTVRIAYDVNVLFKTASVGLDLTVERVEGGRIELSYAGGAGIDFMVRAALGHAQSQPGGEMIELLPDNRIALVPGKSGQAGSLLDHVDLQDICFDERYAIVEFRPRG